MIKKYKIGSGNYEDGYRDGFADAKKITVKKARLTGNDNIVIITIFATICATICIIISLII